MKIKKLFLIALTLYFIGNASFAQTAEHKTYDYVTLVVKRKKPSKIWISNNGTKYLKYKVKEKAKGRFDFSESLKLLNQFEKEGYELVTNNLVAYPSWSLFWPEAYNYFLLRRGHKE